MARTLLVRGLIAGVLAGVLAFLFAKILGEPQIDKAIEFEEALAAAAGDPGEPEVVSRGVQSTLGLFTGTVVMGVALGAIYAIVFAWAYGRVGALGARATAALLALGAFLDDHARPLDEVPGQPADGRQPRHDRQTDAAVRRDDRDLRAGADRGLAAVAAAGAAARLVERRDRRRPRLRRRDRGRGADPAGRPGDAERLPGRRPVALPHHLDRPQRRCCGPRSASASARSPSASWSRRPPAAPHPP